jgi:hypothetical protein
MDSSGEDSSGSPSPGDDQRTLLESAERVAQIGSRQWTPETGELRWSDNLFSALETGAGVGDPDDRNWCWR